MAPPRGVAAVPRMVRTPATAPRARVASAVQVREIWVVSPLERVTPTAVLMR